MKTFIAFLVVALASRVHAKVYGLCELTRELRQQFNFSEADLPLWLCLINLESDFDTAAHYDENDTRHGLFQINNTYCHESLDGEVGDSLCNIPCQNLRDSDITDDVKCAEKIFSVYRFKPWISSVQKCEGKQDEFSGPCAVAENRMGYMLHDQGYSIENRGQNSNTALAEFEDFYQLLTGSSLNPNKMSENRNSNQNIRLNNGISNNRYKPQINGYNSRSSLNYPQINGFNAQLNRLKPQFNNFNSDINANFPFATGFTSQSNIYPQPINRLNSGFNMYYPQLNGFNSHISRYIPQINRFNPFNNNLRSQLNINRFPNALRRQIFPNSLLTQQNVGYPQYTGIIKSAKFLPIDYFNVRKPAYRGGYGFQSSGINVTLKDSKST
ncbi:uncharacterized protein LOC143251581 [Tachypleus tridentatus]|uniref:uncharacterized protein LOC143251581 n=1 Tax=Tachypleus tridentatus TaxID=6853 RepID=UPI003FD1205D